MKLYVEELPKSCERCPFHDTKYGRCDISGSRVEYFGCHSLTPLSDYTKQVRKEVCEEIRKEFLYISGTKTILANNGCIGSRTLEKFLDQIQGE